MSRVAPHARFVERAADMHARTVRRRVQVAATVLAVLALIWAVGFSPALSVRSVQVSGVNGAVAERAESAAQRQRGRPLARLDPGSVEREIGRDEAVRAVHVSRRLPSTLRVQVTPRTPVLAAVVGKNRARLVDRDGYDYAATGRTPGGVPVVKLAAGTKLGPDTGVETLAQVVSALPAAERAKVSDIHLSSGGRIRFHLGTLTVHWGDASASGAKARALATLQAEARHRRSGTVDLSSPSRPVLS